MKYIGGSQRTITVGTSAAVLAPANDNRVALIVGAPVGVSGDGIFLNFTEVPTPTNGLPHYFGTPPLVFHQDQFG